MNRRALEPLNRGIQLDSLGSDSLGSGSGSLGSGPFMTLGGINDCEARFLPRAIIPANARCDRISGRFLRVRGQRTNAIPPGMFKNPRANFESHRAISGSGRAQSESPRAICARPGGNFEEAGTKIERPAVIGISAGVRFGNGRKKTGNHRTRFGLNHTRFRLGAAIFKSNRSTREDGATPPGFPRMADEADRRIWLNRSGSFNLKPCKYDTGARMIETSATILANRRKVVRNAGGSEKSDGPYSAPALLLPSGPYGKRKRNPALGDDSCKFVFIPSTSLRAGSRVLPPSSPAA